MIVFFFQAEDGIRDGHVTGVQTCALPISFRAALDSVPSADFKFLLRWTRNARRPRSARTAKSPQAWAALTTPKVYFCPGIGKSLASSQVICRNTPLLGPPL